MLTLQWATFAATSIAAAGSLVRVAQNITSHRLMRANLKYAKKAHKRKKR